MTKKALNPIIKLAFNSFKIKNYFSYKDPIPNDLKSFLVRAVSRDFLGTLFFEMVIFSLLTPWLPGGKKITSF